MAEFEIEPEELEVEGVAGKPITLPITAGPANGYEWHLELPDGLAQIEDTPGPPLDRSKRLGSTEGGHLQVTAPSGKHTILARLARPWAPDEPVRVVRIHLHVG